MPKQNTPPAEYPQAVLQQIEQLARHIAIARKRRGETQAQWARKLGVSQPTMARIERGDPSVAMASYVMCMWLIQPDHGLADLISPSNDRAALEREVSQVTAKRRKSSGTAKTGQTSMRSVQAAAPDAIVASDDPGASSAQEKEAAQRTSVTEDAHSGAHCPSVTPALGMSTGMSAAEIAAGFHDSFALAQARAQAKSAVDQVFRGADVSSVAKSLDASSGLAAAGLHDSSTWAQVLEAPYGVAHKFANPSVVQALGKSAGMSAAAEIAAGLHESSAWAQALEAARGEATQFANPSVVQALGKSGGMSAAEMAAGLHGSSAWAQALEAARGEAHKFANPSVVQALGKSGGMSAAEMAAGLHDSSAWAQALEAARGAATQFANPNAAGLAALLAAHKASSS
ncbi:MAG TPA: helix-turn-helix domain-containing protein [Burkholderiaceae bacterium]|nr:helix-turn-helix domain-containing protein [Burkholderiaceae bacterium]